MRHLRYEYDLISGNVKMVRYQNGDDGMRHRYTYDADNRITEVETSADALVWHRDAEYFYYPHGPLQRVELGEHKVQGMDYAYTLQGWMKGINSDRLQPETDMGQDGLAGTTNALVARDAYGESIGYHGDGDYKAIDASRWGGSLERPFAALGDPQTATGTLHDAYNPLYNGNIAHTVNSLHPWGGWTTPTQPAQVLAQVYRYDQLNRLKQAQGVQGLTAANTWDGLTDATADRYKSRYTYDANGNIETVERFDQAGVQYDDLHYHYEKSGTQLLRNRLYHLNETIDGGYGDIGVDASAFHGAHEDVNLLNNYQYDELGNLIANKREEIANIEWTVSGKVKHITRTAGSTKPELWFTYGADGQRTSNTVGDPLNGGYREWYLRDAQGNVMAMYKYADNGTSLKVTERPIYGSKRLGSYVRQMELVGEPAIHQWPYTQPMQAPLQRYELTDHLGNVNTVVTGRLLPLLGPGVQYQAEVVSATGYEAFGALLPGRNYSSGSYRYLFQGQEHDDEINGSTGTSYSFEYRMHDPRIGRFLSIDPLAAKYPHNSPYAFSENRVIDGVELEGLETIYYMQSFLCNIGQPALDKLTCTDIGKQIIASFQNTDPSVNFDHVRESQQGTANIGYDLFIIARPGGAPGSTSTVLGKDGVETRTTVVGASGVRTVSEVTQLDALRDALENGEKSPYYATYKERLGEEVFNSDELRESVSRNRGIIIVTMDPADKSYEDDFGGDRAAGMAYKLGHEIGAHADGASKGCSEGESADHGFWNGIKGHYTLGGKQVEGTPARQLQDQLEDCP